VYYLLGCFVFLCLTSGDWLTTTAMLPSGRIREIWPLTVLVAQNLGWNSILVLKLVCAAPLFVWPRLLARLFPGFSTPRYVWAPLLISCGTLVSVIAWQAHLMSVLFGH
jgi:hypothetical protein